MTEAEIDTLLRDMQPDPWWNTRRGNLMRVVGATRVTVFERYGRYRWCIAEEKSVRYSPGSYATEAGAKSAVMKELGR